MTDKYLINCQYGGDDIEKATVAMIVAGAASAMNGETAVFMTGESVRMATKGGVDGLAVEKYPPLKDQFEAYAENGGQHWVCPACAGARGISAEDLIGNAEIAAPRAPSDTSTTAPKLSCEQPGAEPVAFRPVEADGAARAAVMLAELL